jgi:hypothetical protein
MGCENCLNLKVKRLNYAELINKWDDLYYPTEITPGYRSRIEREAPRRNLPLNETALRYVYCSVGVLTRFYIARGSGVIRPKPAIKWCESYR